MDDRTNPQMLIMKHTCLTFLASFLFGIGSTGMAQTHDLLLESTLESKNDLLTLDLYSEELTLGGSGIQRIREGQITVGKPRIKFLSSSKALDGKIKWDYYSVYIPYSLQSLDGGRHYELAIFQVTLKDPRSIAYDIFPSNSIKATTKIRKNISYTADMKFNFKAVEVGGGAKTEDTSEYTVLTPILTPFGKGESQFSWEHRGFKGQHVSPGIKHAAIVLQAPHGLRQIKADLNYRADVYDPLFSFIPFRKIKMDHFPLTLGLTQ